MTEAAPADRERCRREPVALDGRLISFVREPGAIAVVAAGCPTVIEGPLVAAQVDYVAHIEGARAGIEDERAAIAFDGAIDDVGKRVPFGGILTRSEQPGLTDVIGILQPGCNQSQIVPRGAGGGSACHVYDQPALLQSVVDELVHRWRVPQAEDLEALANAVDAGAFQILIGQKEELKITVGLRLEVAVSRSGGSADRGDRPRQIRCDRACRRIVGLYIAMAIERQHRIRPKQWAIGQQVLLVDARLDRVRIADELGDSRAGRRADDVLLGSDEWPALDGQASAVFSQ